MSTKQHKTSRDLQAEARREQLLDCAVTVFAEKGPNAGIKDIAAVAGVASGLVYHYFESKQDLLQTLVRERTFASPLEEFLRDPGEASVLAVLHRVVEIYDEWLARFGPVVPILDELARRDPEFAEYRWRVVNQQFRSLAGYLDGRVAAGELRPHNTDVASRALLYPLFLDRQSSHLGPAFGAALADLLYEGMRPK
ncbi:MAG TPA: TetR/AcrR family transcriptional regulator [Chloroflexota bacterium]|nr:TetR/AcrR family transcriptional regulator [Chloroflexota bacterium]